MEMTIFGGAVLTQRGGGGAVSVPNAVGRVQRRHGVLGRRLLHTVTVIQSHVKQVI